MSIRERSRIDLLVWRGAEASSLLGLPLVAVPIFIHLINLRRQQRIRWAAMQFLLAAMRKNARRLQLQQWLLLAVRTLIIVLVVLAVAEPYGERLLAGGTAAPTDPDEKT